MHDLDPLVQYPTHYPTHTTRTTLTSGLRIAVRLSQQAYTYWLQEAERLQYMPPQPILYQYLPTSTRMRTAYKRTATEEAPSHRFISMFVNYVFLLPETYPPIDTRPLYAKQHDTTLLEANQQLPWNLEPTRDDTLTLVLRIGPLTHAYMHSITLQHHISIRSKRYALEPIPRKPVPATVQVVMESIGIGWLTPQEPFPQAPSHLQPLPPRNPHKTDIDWLRFNAQ